METIYIETTIVSYLVANPSRDSILAAHQKLTRQWWQEGRLRYKCVTSEEVLREASLGDAEMSRRRAGALAGMTALLVDDRARGLARELLAKKNTSARRGIRCHSRCRSVVEPGEHSPNVELPPSGKSAFARTPAGIHGTAGAGLAGDLHSD